MLRYTILAPSCYNTQPWKFAADDNEIKLFADKGRWLNVADGDQRELYISIGCALENLLIAAEHFGYSHRVSYSEDEQAVVVQIGYCGKPSTFRGQELFEAIQIRHTNRKTYQIRPIPPDTLRLLQDVCIEDGITIQMADDMETKEKMVDLVLRANASMFSNPAFRKELGHWYGQRSVWLSIADIKNLPDADNRIGPGQATGQKRLKNSDLGFCSSNGLF